MNVVDCINKANGKTLFSFEILPPLKGSSIKKLYDGIDPLMEFNPSFINVTYHREEYVYKKQPNGLLKRNATRKRPGTVGICAAIKNKYKVEAVPHLTCGGFSKDETEDALIDLNFLGINNVLALRGDPIKSESNFTPDTGGHLYARELVEQIVAMNKGAYISDELVNAESTNFCIGVAGYPEKHFESPSLTSDLQRLKEKVDAGADYVVTQMFFDNQKYFEFVAAAKNIGINVPIIPGIKPIAVERHLQILPKIFSLDLPMALEKAVLDCKGDKASIRQVGIEWAIEQSKELMQKGVPTVHYYSMGKSDNIVKIAKEVF